MENATAARLTIGGNVLTLLGIDEKTEAVYRLMLAHCQWDVAEVADHLALPGHEVQRCVDNLLGLGLVRESRQAGGQWRPVSPDVGLKLLLHEQELALQQQLAQTQAATMRIVEEYTHLRSAEGRHDVEHLLGIDAVQARLEELAFACTSDCRSFTPGGAQSAASLAASKPLDQNLIQRCVSVQTLYQDSMRNDPASMNYARWLIDGGAAVRTAPVLPVRMVLFDCEVALLPVDPENTKKGAVQLSGAGVISALVALFDRVWETATPFGAATCRERNDDGLTAQEVQLLQLLANGLTDEVAARRLGIGLRTVRRMMSDLMLRLAARSRFEAGVRAAQRGWLD